METIIKLANEQETEKYIMFCIKSGLKFRTIGRTKVSVTF